MPCTPRGGTLQHFGFTSNLDATSLNGQTAAPQAKSTQFKSEHEDTHSAVTESNVFRLDQTPATEACIRSILREEITAYTLSLQTPATGARLTRDLSTPIDADISSRPHTKGNQIHRAIGEHFSRQNHGRGAPPSTELRHPQHLSTPPAPKRAHERVDVDLTVEENDRNVRSRHGDSSKVDLNATVALLEAEIMSLREDNKQLQTTIGMLEGANTPIPPDSGRNLIGEYVVQNEVDAAEVRTCSTVAAVDEAILIQRQDPILQMQDDWCLRCLSPALASYGDVLKKTVPSRGFLVFCMMPPSLQRRCQYCVDQKATCEQIPHGLYGDQDWLVHCMLLVDKWVQVSESSRRVLSDAAAKTLCEAIFSLAKAFYKLSIHHKQFHHLNAPQRRNKEHRAKYDEAMHRRSTMTQGVNGNARLRVSVEEGGIYRAWRAAKVAFRTACCNVLEEACPEQFAELQQDIPHVDDLPRRN